jgi:hypothetical protein
MGNMGNYCSRPKTETRAPTEQESSPKNAGDKINLLKSETSSQPIKAQEEVSLESLKQKQVTKDTEIVAVKKSAVSAPLSIILLPHQHSLFCERKQRVCGAVGQTQEYETLKV